MARNSRLPSLASTSLRTSSCASRPTSPSSARSMSSCASRSVASPSPSTEVYFSYYCEHVRRRSASASARACARATRPASRISFMVQAKDVAGKLRTTGDDPIDVTLKGPAAGPDREGGHRGPARTARTWSPTTCRAAGHVRDERSASTRTRTTTRSSSRPIRGFPTNLELRRRLEVAAGVGRRPPSSRAWTCASSRTARRSTPSSRTTTRTRACPTSPVREGARLRGGRAQRRSARAVRRPPRRKSRARAGARARARARGRRRGR